MHLRESGSRDRPPVELLVNIDVPDLEAGVRFYQEALGLRLRRRLFSATVAELTGARGMLARNDVRVPAL